VSPDPVVVLPETLGRRPPVGVSPTRPRRSPACCSALAMGAGPAEVEPPRGGRVLLLIAGARWRRECRVDASDSVACARRRGERCVPRVGSRDARSTRRRERSP
jgi:hypothetical protein